MTEEYRDYLIEIIGPPGEYKARMTRLDGALILCVGVAAPFDQITTSGVYLDADAAMTEAKRVIDAGGMRPATRPR